MIPLYCICPEGDLNPVVDMKEKSRMSFLHARRLRLCAALHDYNARQLDYCITISGDSHARDCLGPR
jgi:hypothetical protein